MPEKETSPSTTTTQNDDVVRLDAIGDAIKAAKVVASNTLLPHLMKMEGVYMNSRRKLLIAPKSDGIIQEALSA